ncbi:histone-fold-containing protein, partial [Sphaerulina musiva SO2202]
RRTKPSVAALREIRRYQKTTELLIRRLPFQRICREVTIDIASKSSSSVYRFQAEALLCLQEATEAFLTLEFEVSNMLAIYAKRVTLQQKDIVLCRWIRKRFLGENNGKDDF